MNLTIPDGLAKDIKEKLGLKTDASIDFLQFALENAKLFDAKMLDYGPYNISAWGTVGCIIRCSDKFNRINNLYKNRRKRTANESIHDSFRDISNYMIISLMLDKKKWPS